MAKQRSIPKKTETKVLTQSRRRCCLCFHLEHDDEVKKDGQIAHVDRDRDNNHEDNLAYLCLRHHAEYDSQGHQAKGFTIGEVKYARAALYENQNGNIQTPLIEITLREQFRFFTPEKQEKFLRDIKKQLNSGSNVSVIQVRPGSVKLILELSKEDAASLLAQANAGTLGDLGVVDARFLHSPACAPAAEMGRVQTSPAHDRHVVRIRTSVDFSFEQMSHLRKYTGHLFDLTDREAPGLAVPTMFVVDREVAANEFIWTNDVPRFDLAAIDASELKRRLDVLLDMHEWRKADIRTGGERRVFDVDTQPFPNSASRAVDELIQSARPARDELLRYLTRLWSNDIRDSASALRSKVTFYPTDMDYEFRLKERIRRRLVLLSGIWRAV